MILAYFIFFSIFTSFRHYNFQTQAWDMAIFSQTLWNTVHGKIMFNSLEEVRGPYNHLAIHMRPFMFLLVPGYALFPSPYFLLIIQTLGLALGAWPIYLLAKKILPPGNWPLILTASYLLYPSLHWVNTFDFHEIAFFIPLFLAAIYFLEMKKWGWMGLFLALAASTKEDAILIVLFVGLYLLLKPTKELSFWNTQRKIGSAVILLSIFYFLLATKIIMPALGGGLLRLDRYAALGNTPSEIITNLIRHPALLTQTIFTPNKLGYLFWIFLPVVFLPFFFWKSLLLIIPGILENTLTDFQSQFAGLYQYDAVIIGGIFIGAIYGLKKVLIRFPNQKILAERILIGAIILGFFFRSPINPLSFPTAVFKSNPKWEAFRTMIRLVPPKASVAAQTNLIPHLANREQVYLLGQEPFPVDITLIDGADLTGFNNENAFQVYADNYIRSGQYRFKNIEDRYFVIYKKDLKLNE